MSYKALPAARHNKSDPDARIVTFTSQLVAGNEAAWEQFHAQYFDRLLRYLLVLCRGDECLAREGLQSSLIKIVRHIRRFNYEDALWSWLTVVARSCVIDSARSQSRYRALLERYAGMFSTSSSTDRTDPLPELLDQCLDMLSAEDRLLITAKYQDGEPITALAHRFGCSEKSVESRLSRLRKRLKEQLLRQLRYET